MQVGAMAAEATNTEKDVGDDLLNIEEETFLLQTEHETNEARLKVLGHCLP